MYLPRDCYALATWRFERIISSSDRGTFARDRAYGSSYTVKCVYTSWMSNIHVHMQFAYMFSALNASWYMIIWLGWGYSLWWRLRVVSAVAISRQGNVHIFGSNDDECWHQRNHMHNTHSGYRESHEQHNRKMNGVCMRALAAHHICGVSECVRETDIKRIGILNVIREWFWILNL